MVRALAYLPYRILKHYCVQLAIVTIIVILFVKSYNSMTNRASTRVVFINNLPEFDETIPRVKTKIIEKDTVMLRRNVSPTNITEEQPKQQPKHGSQTAPSHPSISSVAELVPTVATTVTPFTLPKGISLSRRGKLKTHFYKKYWRRSKEVLAENSGRTPRTLTPFEQAGNNVMITIKTTLAYHRTRIQLLLDTWLSMVNVSNVFVVTDGNDEEYENKAKQSGYHYVRVPCNSTQSREDTCCKTGEELSLMFQPENQHYDWFCHVDDDTYINHAELIKLLSLFDPTQEPVYLGQTWVSWERPTYIEKKQTLFLQRKLRYHYAMGAVYCLTRPMVEKIDPWIGTGPKMMQKCQQLKSEDDRVIGMTVELLTGNRLTRTKSLVRHGIDLSQVSMDDFAKQIALVHGCIQNPHCSKIFKGPIVTPNCPNSVFSIQEDPTRFKSIHCCLHNEAPMCKEATKTYAETFQVCESARTTLLDPPDTPPSGPVSHAVLTRDNKVVMKSYNRYWNLGDEPLTENRSPRNLTPFEQSGNNIMFTIKTTQAYHRSRIQVLLDTWVSSVNASNVFLVTDGFDIEYEKKVKSMGVNYVKAMCNNSYRRTDLCCKTGEELSLMFRPENQHYHWICHLDDDIYINFKKLHSLLSLYDAKNEAIYFGQSWLRWNDPPFLHPNQTLFLNKTLRYHYGMGGLYCLSRPQMERVEPWIGNRYRMAEMCRRLLVVEDQVVGITVELLTGGHLSRTKSYVPHGCKLSVVTPEIFSNQIAVMYGCGQNQQCASKYKDNAVSIPSPAFSVETDPTRFKSVHCYFHPNAPLCKKAEFPKFKHI